MNGLNGKDKDKNHADNFTSVPNRSYSRRSELQNTSNSRTKDSNITKKEERNGRKG